MKKQDKKKERRSSFFDSNGDGEETSDGSSVNMIYLCEFVPETAKLVIMMMSKMSKMSAGMTNLRLCLLQ